MKRTAKALILFFIGFLLVSVSYTKSSEAKEANLMFKGEYFSADLKGTSVNAIFQTLEREKGIWFTGNQSLLDKEVTVRFTNHSLEDGMKRILASMDYCLVFERDGRLVGAVLIGKGKHRTASNIGTPSVREKTIPSRMKKKNGALRKSFETGVVNDHPPIGRSSKGGSSNPKNFKILTNTQSHSTPAEITPEQQRESLKVLRDRPPQGTPAEMTPEQERESLKVLRDRPPPANPNAHPIDTTIIKNHPPPGS